jgi:nitrate/nitrite transport system ATP-binding protein
VLITNDVDEGIMVADRIIPLSAGPGATLGPSVQVDIERPRDRKALNHDSRFKEIRKEVIGYLLGQGGRPKASVTRKLVLPDIEPEDLNVPRGLVSGRISPIRRKEIRQETVEVE